MAIRADSFGTAVEVLAFKRYLLDAQTAFNSTTRPTLTEVEKFIDRASGMLNVEIAKAGFTPSAVYLNSTAKLSMDDWVVTRAVEYVELSQRGGMSGEDNSRWATLMKLQPAACDYVKEQALGLKRLNIAVADPMSQGLTYTGLSKHSERTDPDDATREQPKFRRGQFDSEDDGA